MLTSFFSKSKPINFVVVAVYLAVFYFLYALQDQPEASVLTISKEIGILLILILSSQVIDFIASRNEITTRNAYKTFLFAAFAAMLPEALRNSDVIIANFFVLLALRRIISLKSQRDTRSKIFDATLWILVASLFYFWAVLFVAVVFFGIVLHGAHRIKNWLVPILAFLTVLSIATCVNLLINDSFYGFRDWFRESNFDFSGYREPDVLIAVSFLLALTLWTLFIYVGILQRASANLKASLMLILLCLFTAVGVALLAPTKDSSELMFFLPPLAIIVTNYLQLSRDKWFREILMILIVGLPVLLLFLYN